MTAYNINSQRLTVIPVPFDAKRTNCYVSGSNIIIETIAEYLTRVTSDIRDVTPVYMIIPKIGYSAGTFPIATFSATLANFDIKKYAFVEGLADVNFTDITGIITETDPVFTASDAFAITSGDISNWNGKQDALGFTPEDVANKVTSFQVTPDDTHYASEKLVKDNLDLLSPASFYADVMTVNTGTLDQGVVGDLAALGGTDVIISEALGVNPLTVTFNFTDVTKMTEFVFYGYYNGGAGHQILIEIYTISSTNWDEIGTIGAETTKHWDAFPIFNSSAYMNAGAVSVRFRHVDSGNITHDLILDYLELNYGGSGGSSNVSASSVNFIPFGNISATNVAAALTELDNEKLAISDYGFIQVTSLTLSQVSWSLVSGLYEYDLSDANITANTVVDVIPDNADVAIVKAAEILPRTDSSAGSVKIYATNEPTDDIGVTINILPKIV